MPGFCRFLTGTYLFPGPILFGTFTASPPLYMPALAFSAYGVHWFALGWDRLKQADHRVTWARRWPSPHLGPRDNRLRKGRGLPSHGPVHGSDLHLSLRHPGQPGRERAGPVPAWHQADGVLHLGVGIWLMYLMFAPVLDLVFKDTLYL
jgi:hypothetical protein